MYFENPADLNELKLQYRKLALKNHPDRGGSTEVMAEIKREYDELFERLSLKAEAEEAAAKGTTDASQMDDGYRVVVDALLNIPGIEIEQCGSWLWISGETKKHKDEIKAAGCYWSAKKKMWYWRPETKSRRWNRKSISMDAIRFKYGSSSVSRDDKKRIA